MGYDRMRNRKRCCLKICIMYCRNEMVHQAGKMEECKGLWWHIHTSSRNSGIFSKAHKLTDPSHVGIVTKVCPPYIYTVEGNTSDAVHERIYRIDDKYIIGYGVPSYVDNVKADIKDNDTGYQTVEVKKGDTLWDIAEKYLGSGSRYREIMSLNSLTSATIHPGLVLSIPGTNAKANEASKKTKAYTVKKGDTLWDIAAKYLGSGSRYREIMSLSKITSTTIHVGQILTLPAV
ncbi:LysM peptidoglycan-binding domain-containing protein [Clostridium sp. AM54-37XD]|nr:LysM peptidoglycan-binding domain-containing protein [Clostridium sp. AM54-37XD]